MVESVKKAIGAMVVHSPAEKNENIHQHSSDRVAARLRQAILEGEMGPGTRLKDTHLANTYGVSRNTMRDALKQLAEAGLVTTRMHSGSSVRVLTEEDVRDIYRVRHVLEETAILQSTYASTDQLKRLRTTVRATLVAHSKEEWEEVNTATMYFHQAIVQLLGSSRIDEFFENILAQLRLSFGFIPLEREFHSHWPQWDEEIAKLILQGDRERAANEMARYLTESEARTIDVLRSQRNVSLD